MKNYYLTFGSVSPAAYTGLFPTLTIFSLNGTTPVTAPGITETPASSGLYRFQWGATTSIVFVCDGGATLANNVRYIVGSIDPVQAVDEQLTSVGNSLAVIGASTAAIGSSVLAIGIAQSAMGTSLSAMGSSTAVLGPTLFAIGASVLGIGVNLGAQGTSQLSIGSTVFAIGQTLIQVGQDVLAIGSSTGSVSALIGTPADSFGSTSVDPTTVFGYLKRNLEFEEGQQIFEKQTGVWSIYSRGASTLLREQTLSNTATETTRE